MDDDGICDTDEVAGCTDSLASNYDDLATEENGSCTYLGCTDAEADNFDAIANTDDGTCEYSCTGLAGCTYPTAINFNPQAVCDDGNCTFFDAPPNDTCPFDADGNGIIGAADLIILLSLFETSCE